MGLMRDEIVERKRVGRVRRIFGLDVKRCKKDSGMGRNGKREAEGGVLKKEEVQREGEEESDLDRNGQGGREKLQSN